MSQYKIYFGNVSEKRECENIEIIPYFDSKNNKKIINVKDFLTHYNDELCTCMLKLYKIEGVISWSYTEYRENNEDNLNLKDVHNKMCIAIMKTKKYCDCQFVINNNEILKKPKKELINSYLEQKKKINELQGEINLLVKKDEWDNCNKVYEKFYDIVIDINSILKLKNGWKIHFTEEGENKYNEYKNEKLIKIGVVGNMNKGKSFILSKLSKINLLAGTSLNTKGISVKYPKLENSSNRKYILVDSAGFESPILRYDDDDNIYTFEKENEAENEEDKQQNLFREKAKDILITESFLQNFLIEFSDVLLLVVDNLTYSEQKVINKIKDEIKNLRKTKKLFIIHNLKTFRTEEQIKNYIDKILLKSGTFTLSRHEHITSESNIIKGEHFTEPEQKYLRVYHLIFAADQSDAGKIYNSYTMNFIEHQINDTISPNNFDVIEEIKKNLSKNYRKYLIEKISEEDFIDTEEMMSKKIIQLKEEKPLKLKRCFIDEIGIQKFKGSGFEPQYNFFKNNDKLEIRVELPGNVKPSIKKPEFVRENTIIQINGKKNPDKEPKNLEDNLENTRDFGDFDIEIAFKTEDCKINPILKEKVLKNGLLLLKYDIEDDKSEKNEITLSTEEEI